MLVNHVFFVYNVSKITPQKKRVCTYNDNGFSYYLVTSGKSLKADQIIAEITKGYEQTRVMDRIYNALRLWREKCYSVDDKHMVIVFTDSFYKHQEHYNQTRSR